MKINTYILYLFCTLAGMMIGCESRISRVEYFKVKRAIYDAAAGPISVSWGSNEIWDDFFIYMGENSRAYFREVWLAHVRNVCDSLGVPFEEFSMASKRYGELEMNYTDKLDHYLALYTEVNQTDYDQVAEEMARKEILAEMAYDLGISPPRTVVKITLEDKIYVNSKGSRLREVYDLVDRFSAYTYGTTIVVSPEMLASRVFELAEHMPWQDSTCRVSVVLHRPFEGSVWPWTEREALYDTLYRFHPSPPDPEELPFPGITVVAGVDNDGVLFLNFSPVDSEEEFYGVATTLFKFIPSEFAILTLEDEVKWGDALLMVAYLMDSGADHVIVVPHEMFSQDYTLASLYGEYNFNKIIMSLLRPDSCDDVLTIFP